MGTHVDELVNEVAVEPEPAASPVAAPPTDWETLARLREQRARLMEDRWRTAAEGFDD